MNPTAPTSTNSPVIQEVGEIVKRSSGGLAGGYQPVSSSMSQNRADVKYRMYQYANPYEKFTNQMGGGNPQAFNGHNKTRFYSVGPQGRYDSNGQSNGVTAADSQCQAKRIILRKQGVQLSNSKQPSIVTISYLNKLNCY